MGCATSKSLSSGLSNEKINIKQRHSLTDREREKGRDNYRETGRKCLYYKIESAHNGMDMAILGGFGGKAQVARFRFVRFLILGRKGIRLCKKTKRA